MGTVEWSELLRWVPREPGQEFQASNQHEAAPAAETCVQAPAAQAPCEPGKLTLASL
jgi:hypothetical protein